MDGDWETVKAQPKKKSTKPKVVDNQPTYGGKGAHGKLVAGPVKQGKMATVHEYSALNNQASAIAEYDYDLDDNFGYEEQKLETVSHTCAQAVSEARTAKKMSQEKLAHAIGEKTSVIVDIENGTALYKGGQINNIEKALGVKIPRGRGKKNKK